MALSDWRRDRAICLEREQLAMEIRRQQQAELTSSPQSGSDAPAEVNPMECNALAFRTVVDQSRAHEYLNRFENRHDRQYNRALRNFLNYRNERRKQEKLRKRRKKSE
jgi:hypothetical protein